MATARARKSSARASPGIPEEEIFLATKAFPTDPKKVRASLERSLKNLRRDRIDLLQLHGSYLGPEVGGRSSARAAFCRSSKSSRTRAW